MGEDEPKPFVDCLLGDTTLENFEFIGDRCDEGLPLGGHVLVLLLPWLPLYVARTPVDGVLVEKS